MRIMAVKSLPFLIIMLMPVPVLPRDVAPVVSTDWLAQNLDNPRLVVLDIRNIEQYKKGHIPGAFHTPFSAWVVENNNLSMELPPDEAILALLGSLGINSDSIVVVVNRSDTDYARADPARVAWTCIIAGVKNASVLDGGINKWTSEEKAVSAEVAKPKPAIYAGKVDRSAIALKRHVLRRIGKSAIVDNRVPEDYFGIGSLPGHIKSAVNLPAPWIFTKAGLFRDTKELLAMAEGVIGKNKSREVILYCEVGVYASTWSFLLTQMLGYQNVKLYDGSMQEWIKDPRAPLTAYGWR